MLRLDGRLSSRHALRMLIGLAPAWRGLSVAIAFAVFASSAAEGGETGRLLATERPSPGLRLDRLGGGRLTAAEHRGRVVLVHFFATWCEPCRPELAALDRLRGEAAARGLDILAVSVAEVEARLHRFFSVHPVGFPILLDRDRTASRAWAVDALPSTLVLDRAGQVRLAVRGDLDWARGDVRAALDNLLAEPSPEPAHLAGGNDQK